MAQIDIHDATANFSELIERVERGEEIVIARAGNPVALLAPVRPSIKAPRKLGAWKGRLEIAPDFDEFTDEDAAEWGAAG